MGHVRFGPAPLPIPRNKVRVRPYWGGVTRPRPDCNRYPYRPALGRNPVMTTESPAALVDIACDYLHAVIQGPPAYASTVADNYGTWRVSRGMATLLVFLACDAAEHSDTTPGRVIESIRETYARGANAEAS